MKESVLALLLVVVLTLTACQPASIQDQFEEGESLLRQRSYGEAIEIFEAILAEDSLHYDSWHELTKAYYRDGQTRNAAETLEAYYQIVKEDYDRNPEVGYQGLLKDIMAFGYDIRKDGGQVGDWLDGLEPPVISLSDVPYEIELGGEITLEVPQGAELYWTLDGSKPDTSDPSQRYTGPIVIEEEGERTLTVIGVNEFGMEGPLDNTWISSYDLPQALYPNMAGGSYDERLTVFFPDYDDETMDIYYTTDGSDPEYGYYYDESTGIKLPYGDVTLRVVYYDYTTDDYSRESLTKYTINNPYVLTEYTELTVAIFGMDENTAYEVEYALSELNYSSDNLSINYYRADDLDLLASDLADGYTDMVYTQAYYAEDFAPLGSITPIEDLFGVSGDDYMGQALEAGRYQGNYYCLPVTVNPNLMLYYAYDDVGDYWYDANTWEALVNQANAGTATYNFLYPEDYAGEWLFSYYLGFGGTLTELADGGYGLNEEALIDAMTFAYDLPIRYGLGYEGMDMTSYVAAMEEGSATWLYASTYDMTSYDQNALYGTVGSMPLPNGGQTSSVNMVEGMMVSPMAIMDTNTLNAAKLVYDTVGMDYYANYIAGYSDSMPAAYDAYDSDYLYLKNDALVYEEAINNNITVPYTYNFFDLMNLMSEATDNVNYGNGDIETIAAQLVADAMILGQ